MAAHIASAGLNNWVLPHLPGDWLDRARGTGVASTQKAEMALSHWQVHSSLHMVRCCCSGEDEA